MNLNSNDAHVATLLPALSEWKVYVTPSYEPVLHMAQHFSTSGMLYAAPNAAMTCATHGAQNQQGTEGKVRSVGAPHMCGLS